jgi:peroxiredoxin
MPNMKTRMFLLIAFLPLLLASQNPLTINGTLVNAPEKRLVLKHYDAQKQQLIDSVYAGPEGAFVFTVEKPMGGLYIIEIDGNNIAYIFPQSVQRLKWTADFNDVFASTRIEGSAVSVHMLELLKASFAYSAKLDSIENRAEELYYGESEPGQLDSVLASYDRLEEESRVFFASQIKAKPSFLSNTLFIDKLPEDDYFEHYDLLDNNLMAAHKTDPLTQSFHRKVETMRLTKIGALAPEIELPSPDGPAVKLSSLRGKVVLIDFWASWCGPCRRENPNVVKMYQRFKDKGFEIYGVSLDRARENWLDAIEKDGLSWIHVSDIKFWQCEAAKTYGVTTIPYTVLLDREGKIIAKGLRGEKLEKKIEEMLK